MDWRLWDKIINPSGEKCGSVNEKIIRFSESGSSMTLQILPSIKYW